MGRHIKENAASLIFPTVSVPNLCLLWKEEEKREGKGRKGEEMKVQRRKKRKKDRWKDKN